MNRAIEKLFRDGKTAQEIIKILKGSVSCSGVFKAIKRLKETGSAQPRVRSTPKRPVRTQKLVKNIREKLRRNPARSATKLAQEAQVSLTTMRRLLKHDLHTKPYKVTKRQLLSDTTKKKRVERAKLLLKKLKDNMQPTVLWTDEKLFTVQAVHNPQNDRVWGKTKESIPVELRTAFRRQKPSSVMVWAGVTLSGMKTLLIFVEDGVKINQHVYLNMLKDKVVPWMNSLSLDDGLTLQQDGATAHTAKMVQEWCKEHFKAFWPKDIWPPSSPDLNPMDFGIWSILEQKACKVSHSSVVVLKQKLTESWDEIDFETVRATCVQVSERLRRVIRAKGGYIE